MTIRFIQKWQNNDEKNDDFTNFFQQQRFERIFFFHNVKFEEWAKEPQDLAPSNRVPLETRVQLSHRKFSMESTVRVVKRIYIILRANYPSEHHSDLARSPQLQNYGDRSPTWCLHNDFPTTDNGVASSDVTRQFDDETINVTDLTIDYWLTIDL